VSVIDRFRLDGRVAIVTGASSGLGVTLAQTLAEAGADVVLAARRVDGLKATAASIEELGRRAHVVPADVGVREDCDRVVAEAYDAFGRLDVLVNNAGTGRVTPALKEEPDEFERVLRVNLTGSHFTACAAARRMEPGASIVNIASVLAFTSGGIPQAAYTASKAGVVGLTRDLAGQWTSRRGIRVNAVAPGFFKTEMTEHDLDDTDDLSRRIMVGRLGDPAELAAAVVFLASDASSYITGTTLTVDGGFTAS
jgi:NAD(P)-dependent dehydrogenase (short-subunit alcohol dehydrogenase family)